MTTRADSVAHTFATDDFSVPTASASRASYDARLSEAPFVTTLTVDENELHRVSLVPLYLHEARPSKRCEPFYMSAPPEVTFTPDDSELHPLTLAINPITITLPGLSGVSALKPAEVDPLLGQTIAGKYKLLARAGRGGAGVVYKAQELTTGSFLAMKVLSKDITTRRHALNQLRQEAKATAKLSHQHTVKMVEFGETEQFVYLAMEYLEGIDLASTLRREGPLSEARAIQIALQICQSVAQAHQHGIVHRDIKPENVFVTRSAGHGDFIKVLDFGVAQVREADDSFTQCKSLVYGTPNYMAPEQIRGEVVDARTDVYALGALLYKVVSGVAPFAGETPKAVLDKHLREVVTPMRTKVAGLEVSDALEALVAKALSKDPQQRQQSMEQMQAELTAMLAPPARSVKATKKPKKSKNKKKANHKARRK